MAAVLGLSVEELFAQYLRRSGNCVQMRTVDNHCIFFDQGCRIHTARPRLCGQWPLHPAILKDEGNYKAISTSCPGLNTALSYEQFCRLLEQIFKSGDIIC
jgi:Fe-S-cluster containining protein